MLSKHSLFSVREEQETATILLVFNQALEDFFSSVDKNQFTPKKIAAFIRRLAALYGADETFKTLLPQNKQALLLRHSLYETAAALGDESATQHLSQLREAKEQTEILFTNLLSRAKQHSFGDFIKHLNLSSTAEAPCDEAFIEYLREAAQLGKASTTDLKSQLEDLSKSYSQSKTIRHLTSNYPAYRSWIKTQVDTENARTELKKIAAKGPASYLKDFMENHGIELESEVPEKSTQNKLFTHLLLTLSEISASPIFTQAAEDLTHAASSVKKPIRDSIIC